MTGPTSARAGTGSPRRAAPSAADRPLLAGTLPAPPGVRLGAPVPAGGTGPAGGLPAVLTATGRFRPGELRTFSGPSGTVVVFGQCLADERMFAEAAGRLLESGDTAAVARWPGSFLCLVTGADGLTAYADPAEQYPLYYRYSGGRTHFATRPAAAAPDGCRPAPAVLAARILCPDAPVVADDATPVAGVRRLAAGEALRITADGRPTRWTYEDLLPAADRSPAEAAHDLGAALDRAVRLRAGDRSGTLTADFSGGLDSTSLAFLALRHLPAPAGLLQVVTYSGRDAARDDLEHARRFADLDPRLRLHEVAGGDGALPYLGLDAAGTHEPSPAAASRARTLLRLRRAARLGGDVHLGGEGGDALLTAPPAYLADLLRAGRVRQALRDTRALARSRDVSPAAAVAAAARLARTTPAAALRRTADVLERPGDRPDAGWLDALAWWPDPGPETHWLTVRARRELAASARDAAADSGGGADGAGPADRTTRQEVRTASAAQRWLADEAAAFGVWPQAPFLDAEVVRACLRLPAHRRAAPPAVKPLLRMALRGRVPQPVLERRTKGDYSEEEYAGARTAAPALRALVDGGRLADLGVIEPAAVLASLDRATAGVRAPFAALNRLLAAELWLRSGTWG